MLDKAVDAFARLRKRGELRSDLIKILETPEGQRFFKVFLRECHVTKPVFHSDESKLRECDTLHSCLKAHVHQLTEGSQA